jgi:hypothetical protein
MEKGGRKWNTEAWSRAGQGGQGREGRESMEVREEGHRADQF